MKSMDKITREFKVMRGDREMIYPFTTFSCVLDSPPSGNKIRDRLFEFLKGVVIAGVPSIKGKMSVSESAELIIKVARGDSNLIQHAKLSDYRNRTILQHSYVQNYLLKNDPFTIATEVPVWDDKESGHIDILRLFDDYIEVADFKPNAHKETTAATQVYKYIVKLGRALRLPISCFKGVYFDDTKAYFLTL